MSITTIAKHAFSAGTAIVLLASLAACGGSSTATSANPDDDEATINVVASINQWGSVARDLGGDLVRVTDIMTNTNVEAHGYEPTASDVATFTKAQVAVVNGADYDSWASKAAGHTDADVVDAARTCNIKDGDNPHVWFSSAVRNATADAITNAYIKANPENKAQFDKLNEAWHRKSDALEAKIDGASDKLKGLDYAATESVAWYLADDLGMSDATPSGYAKAAANESEPSPSDLQQFAETLGSGDIKLLVVNSQEADSTTAQLTDAAKHANVPIVGLTEQMPRNHNDLLEWMDSLVDEISRAAEAMQ